MPELPEVETVVRDMAGLGLVGRRVVGCRAAWPRTVGGSLRTFSAAVRGCAIVSVARRAKYIVIELARDGCPAGVLLVHLRMTGRLVCAPAGDPRPAAERAALVVDDGREVRFIDSRKFGRVLHTLTPEHILDRLGPEPLERAFTLTRFRRIVCVRRGMLKPVLLDQRVIAGIGNIYADEALWEARLHPMTPMAALDADRQAALYRAIRRVLRRGIKAMGTSLGEAETSFYSVAGRRGRNQDGLRVFRRTGLPCPRCDTPIARLVVGQRGTHICPACQPRVDRFADE